MRFACLLLFLVASAAAAEDAGSVRFLILDLDGDGYVSLAEAAGIGDVVERFDRADADRDGRLSAREFDRLERVRVHTASKRQRVRAAVARDARAAERQASAETASAESAPSAAAGASR
jgi:hypothetical protein